MTVHVTTAVFDGPLDLLLQLINRHQVDVAEVNLALVVEEFIAHLETMEAMDLEVTSEFLLIAATLVQLKARRLLPPGAALDLDEELALMEERDRLLSRLLLCVTFKDVASVLLRRLQEAARYVPRQAGIDQTFRVRQPDFALPIDAAALGAMAQRVFARATAEPDLDHLELDLPSVESAMDDLRTRMVARVESTFEEIVAGCRNQLEVSAYFLALLELTRWGLLHVSQEHWLAPIRIVQSQTTELDLR
ncbi:MAG TPA: ScpA family protein [Acidimicrobiia bacterium]|jgi:segregation and condensation protein A